MIDKVYIDLKSNQLIIKSWFINDLYRELTVREVYTISLL
jgi:hypothetical protein